MNHFLFCVVALAAFASVSNAGIILGSATLTRSNSSRAIDGILDCGSESVVVDVRLEGTDGESCDSVPCEAVIGKSYRVEAEFRPKYSHDDLRLNIFLVQAPEQYEVVNTLIENSAVEEGVSYTLGYNFAVTGEFTDNALMIFRLIGREPNVQVVCQGITLNVPTPEAH